MLPSGEHFQISCDGGGRGGGGANILFAVGSNGTLRYVIPVSIWS